MKATVAVFVLMFACFQGFGKHWSLGSDVIAEPNEVDQYALPTTLTRRWPDKTVPYIFDLEAENKFTEDQIKEIKNAMGWISDVSCLKFKPRENQVDYINIQYLGVGDGSCWSQVGLIGKKQDVQIALRCINSIYSTVHELLHAVGFAHEHKRYDRDIYLQMNWKNIPEDKRTKYNKEPRLASYTPHSYDHLSVMHYAIKKSYFSVRPGLPYGDLDLGQRRMISQNDRLKLISAYKCDTGGAH